MSGLLAALVAVVAAAVFGLASVFEQRSTKEVPVRSALSPRLVLDLLRRPLFLAALLANVIGSALQILALHLGSLTVVQPVLVLDLLFAVLIAAALRRRPPDRVLVAGVIGCVAGIAGFLAVASPHGGTGMAGPGVALPLIASLVAVLAACLAAARWGPARARPLWLALACGVDFGVNAFLLKVVPNTVPLGFSDPLRQWPLYLIVLVTPAGFLLNQNAFQASILIAPVLAIITTVDPLVSVTVGVLFLHEKIAFGPSAIAGELAALVLMTSGIVALAHRAPQVTQQKAGEPAPEAAPGISHPAALCCSLARRRSREAEPSSR